MHLCAFKDLWSNRIVDYSINDRMTAQLAVSAIHNAATLRDPDGTVIHTDRGSQFRFRAFTVTLDKLGRGDGPSRCRRRQRRIESFFSLPQKNVFNTRRWDTRDQPRTAIGT